MSEDRNFRRLCYHDLFRGLGTNEANLAAGEFSDAVSVYLQLNTKKK